LGTAGAGHVAGGTLKKRPLPGEKKRKQMREDETKKNFIMLNVNIAAQTWKSRLSARKENFVTAHRKSRQSSKGQTGFGGGAGRLSGTSPKDP